MAEKMAETMAPLSIIGGKSIVEVFANLLQGTQLEKVLKLHSATPEETEVKEVTNKNTSKKK